MKIKDYPSLFDEQTRHEANAFAGLCFSKKRWYGSGLLIIMDACFDSIGLNYFTVVVPKVKYFYDNFFIKKNINSVEAFLKFYKEGEIGLIKNGRAWGAIHALADFVHKNRKEGEQDIDVLYRWAIKADPEKKNEDPIGRIKGIGINTFQYLRMQVGVDSTMPDKIIRRWLLKQGIKTKDEIDTIKKMEEAAGELGISQVELCWAIWISESGEKGKVDIV